MTQELDGRESFGRVGYLGIPFCRAPSETLNGGVDDGEIDNE